MVPVTIAVASPAVQGQLPISPTPVSPTPVSPPARAMGDALPGPAEGRDQAVAAPVADPRSVEPSVTEKVQAAPLVPTAGSQGLPPLEKPSERRAGPMAKAVAATLPPSEPLAISDDAPVAPAPNGKPLKSEALALLQLIREQVGSRPSGAPARVGEQLPALAGKRAPDGGGPAAATAPAIPATVPDLTQSAPAPTAPAPALSVAAPATPVADLSASLNTQVVDMGVSGQWIDGLARDIAGLSTHGAQGRFQINADQLGPVQVDIRQGSEGAAVHMTVASEAAEMALRQDSDRLKLDAGLSAVRIAEVKIDRVPHVSEPSRADSAGQQSSQQQSQQSAGQGGTAWANNGQNMGQPQSQQGRWRPGENNGFTPKSSGDPAVLNHAQ